MKRLLVTGMSIFIVFLGVIGIFARDSAGGKGSWPSGGGCSHLEDLGLSEKQVEAARKTEKIYSEPIFRFRKAMMFKHIELRNLMQDPESADRSIRSKSLEIEGLRKELRQNILDYQIALRAILTPDQIRRWCTLIGTGFPSRMGSRWP